MKECYEYTVKMNMYLDGELPVNQIPALLKHIESCPRCQARFEALRAVAFETRSLSVTPPDNLHSSIMENIKKNAELKKRKKIINLRPFILAACAAMLILFSGALAGLNNIYLFGKNKSESAKSESTQMYMADIAGTEESENAKDSQAPETSENGARSFSKAGSSTSESVTGSTGGVGTGSGEMSGAALPNSSMSGQDAATDEQKEKTLLLEAVMPEGFAFYRIWEGQGLMPEILQSESKVSYDDSGITVIYLKNESATWNSIEDALIQASYRPIGDDFAGAYPKTDTNAAQGLLILVSKK